MDPSKKALSFTSLPPEIRNTIYGLLLHLEYSVVIVSPRPRKGSTASYGTKFYYSMSYVAPNGEVKRRSPAQRAPKMFASLIGVNRAIGEEARTSFYGGNRFVVGTGGWGSTLEVNFHVRCFHGELKPADDGEALKAFISRVPHHAIALIQNLELRIFFGREASERDRRLRPCDAADLEAMCRAILKYFIGVEKMVVTEDSIIRGTTKAPLTLTVGPMKALKMLLELKRLKELCFVDEVDADGVQFQCLVDKLQEDRKEERVLIRAAKTRKGDEKVWTVWHV